MIINITQHCTLQCPHCMQNAGPHRHEYMSSDTFTQALQFASDIRSRIVCISGGEPTTHPRFLEYLQQALSMENILLVTVCSNGTFVSDESFTSKFASLVSGIDKFMLQVSCFKDLYTTYSSATQLCQKLAEQFGSRFMFITSTEHFRMQPLGRASQGPSFARAERIKPYPSCTNSALALLQSPFPYAGRSIEYFGRFCTPMVSFDGSIRLGESEQCRVVANISEPLPDINRKLFAFRPCGNCQSYKWHFDPPATDKDRQVCTLLWPEQYGK